MTDTEHLDAEVARVVETFERRIAGTIKPPRCGARLSQNYHTYRDVIDAAHKRPPPPGRLTWGLLPSGMRRKRGGSASSRGAGGSRHSKSKGGDADEQDNEEQAELESEVLRTEVQPKCIKGGAMREYQVRARARAAALSELYPALPLSGLEARGPEARADHGVCRSRGSTG